MTTTNLKENGWEGGAPTYWPRCVPKSVPSMSANKRNEDKKFSSSPMPPSNLTPRKHRLTHQLTCRHCLQGIWCGKDKDGHGKNGRKGDEDKKSPSSPSCQPSSHHTSQTRAAHRLTHQHCSRDTGTKTDDGSMGVAHAPIFMAHGSSTNTRPPHEQAHLRQLRCAWHL